VTCHIWIQARLGWKVAAADEKLQAWTSTTWWLPGRADRAGGCPDAPAGPWQGRAGRGYGEDAAADQAAASGRPSLGVTHIGESGRTLIRMIMRALRVLLIAWWIRPVKFGTSLLAVWRAILELLRIRTSWINRALPADELAAFVRALAHRIARRGAAVRVW